MQENLSVAKSVSEIEVEQQQNKSNTLKSLEQLEKEAMQILESLPDLSEDSSRRTMHN